ncbi:hypothetical protein K493DRAFT_317509 [Basidiobolus meristosporus CBS 931.73]|uniref:Uncharacterized protein n=1 Tax=Basidiobolus meristosporus CBS 931.73 TaxID=1314790 RepID=A0A1Y1XZE6_9FUNG|nr:hypothetical protein K493DRAFT_317509 [Basidiobolus meristosporus CBS 931.73]|eukprot:ORX91099.1 hypothetical protein K493DRAFT_317509 [Basidiobolus meristosporus CBS 931.73]
MVAESPVILSPPPLPPATFASDVSRKRCYDNDTSTVDAQWVPKVPRKYKKSRVRYFANSNHHSTEEKVYEEAEPLQKLQITTKAAAPVNTTKLNRSSCYHEINSLLAALHRDRLERSR